MEDEGVKKASQISQALAEEYQQHLLDEYAPNTVQHCMYAASGMLSFAVNRGYLSDNVVKKVKKVKAEKNQGCPTRSGNGCGTSQRIPISGR